jgi:hypothetical protein
MPADQIHLGARDRPPRDDSGRFARLSCTKDTGLPALTRTYPLTDRSCNTLPPGGIPVGPPSQWRISNVQQNGIMLRPARPDFLRSSLPLEPVPRRQGSHRPDSPRTRPPRLLLGHDVGYNGPSRGLFVSHIIRLSHSEPPLASTLQRPPPPATAAMREPGEVDGRLRLTEKWDRASSTRQ